MLLEVQQERVEQVQQIQFQVVQFLTQEEEVVELAVEQLEEQVQVEEE
jgi:hypothetical protein